MAGRLLNRREMREPAASVEALAPDVPAIVAASRKKRTPAATKVRKPRAKKAPPRLRARWGVFDGGMKQVAIFDYNQRAAANDKLADLRAKHKWLYFLQIVKDPMPEPEAVPASA
jgi:hypothetical protein